MRSPRPLRPPARLLAALLVLAAACGGDPARDPEGATNLDRAPGLDGGHLEDPSQEAAEALRSLDSLGYLGSEEEAAGRPVGLLVHDRERSWPGLNLYTSGHAAEAVLMDMEARVLHRWSGDFHRTFPAAPPDPEAESRGRHHWRRVYLLADGGLIAIHEGQGLLRIDRASEVVWASDLRAHHAAEVSEQGELWVLTRKLHSAPYRGAPRPLAEDFVSVVDPDTGELLRETSVLRAFMRSDFRAIAEASDKLDGDVLHTNSLELLDGRFADRDPAFAAGNLLLSSRVLHTVFVLDPAFDEPAEPDGRARVVWAQRGSWRSQHEPHLLPDGRILLFDNSGAEPHSRVLEIGITPAGQQAPERVVFEGTDERRFYTKFCGAAARLPNGNTLITETGPGRVFEVTPAGEVVWEFVNPAQDEGKVASIFELVRLAPRDVPWASSAR